MEPRDKPKSPKTSEQQGKEKKRRFQIVKLEERIAPGGGHTGKNGQCNGGGAQSGTSSGSIY